MVYVKWCYITFGTAVINTSKSLAGDSIQFSVALVRYVQFVATFVLLSLGEVYPLDCCLSATEYGPCVGGYF